MTYLDTIRLLYMNGPAAALRTPLLDQECLAILVLR